MSSKKKTTWHVDLWLRKTGKKKGPRVIAVHNHVVETISPTAAIKIASNRVRATTPKAGHIEKISVSRAQ